MKNKKIAVAKHYALTWIYLYFNNNYSTGVRFQLA